MAKDPSGGGQPQSMLQGLQAILGQLGALMAAPDGDVQFLTQLQHAIVGKIKQSTQHAVGGGGAPGQGNAIAPGGGAGMAGFGAGGTQGGPPGGGPAPGPGSMPNPDELRRVMGANAQSGVGG